MADPQTATAAPTAAPWASILGVGRFPLMSGTAASAVATAVYVLCALCLAPEPLQLLAFCLGIAILFSAVTIGDGERLARQLDRTDPSEVVSDEIAGIFLCFALLSGLPVGWAAALGFAGFRAFDGLKPFGIRRLERLPGGWGILADDLAAGLAAALLIRALLWAPNFFVDRVA